MTFLRFQWGLDRSITGYFTTDGIPTYVLDTKAVAAEFVGMFMFVTLGCGAACANGAYDGESRLFVAFAFGMSIMVIAYAIGHHSGGHLNCAVTFSLVLGRQVPWYQGLANALAQLVAGIIAACLLAIIFPCEMDVTTNLGSNLINPNYHTLQVLVAEAFGTFLLCFTVWETAVTPVSSSGKNACIAIGFSVFVAHLILLPIDGCSINPTRSFGPAMISYARGCDNYTPGGLGDLWVMWIGPLFGATAAAGMQRVFAPDLDRLKRLEADAKEWLLRQQALEGPMETTELLSEKGRDDFDGVQSSPEKEPQRLSSSIIGKCFGVI